MQEYSRGAIATQRFTIRRRKGYDAFQVDDYLGQLAEYVGRLEGRLAQCQATERAALDVLHQAQRVAAETVAAAECDAEKMRQNAKDGLEALRKDALATLDAARAEADQTLLSARVQAEADIERSRLEISELEVAGRERSREFDQIVEESRDSAVQSATELRSVGERLVEMAEHFEFKLATGGEMIGDPDQGMIDFGEERVEVA